MAADFEWDFSKLPKSEHKKVIELTRAAQFKQLIQIHNKYQLSMHSYCCENEMPQVLAWYQYAIDNKLIS